MAKLTINLVTWNGAKYIPYLFDSLRKQAFQDFEVQVLDNGSTDGTREVINTEIEKSQFEVHTIARETNTGFVGGHNQLFRKTQSEYVLLCNQDMYLQPDYCERLVQALDVRPKAGSVSGRLMKWEFAGLADSPGALERSFTQYIDTLGLRIFRSRRVVDWYAGGRWPDLESRITAQGQLIEVFGVSGALPIYRMSALNAVAFEGDVFDPTYFAYKEDVDLAWRLRINGWTAHTDTAAVAHHDRSAAEGGMGDTDAAKNRKNKSAIANYHSYKNHIATVLKNVYWSNYLKDWPWIEWYEIKKFGYLMLFDFKTWKGFWSLMLQWPALRHKRSFVKTIRKVKAKEIRVWWTQKQK